MMFSARGRLALIASLVAWSASAACAREAITMSDEAFWAIVDATAMHEADPETQLDALSHRLASLPPADIVAFEAAFQRQMQRAYTWELWGAGYVAHGGMSDDGFEYFRRWLISKGHGVFERVLASPDDLAMLLAEDSEGPLEFEEFAYVAGQVWHSKAGSSIDAFYERAPSAFPGGAPEGEPFREDDGYLATRYPKLWRRFGASPLQ
jgi:hypothetical protein